MPLDDSAVDDLMNLIRDSFRIHPNQDPIYVDVGGHLRRLAAKQHQVIFGRRGSGKSCLLVHHHRSRARTDNVLSIYVNADEMKTLPYPDLLIRLLLTIGEEIARVNSGLLNRLRGRRSRALESELPVLRALLDEAEVSHVSRETSRRSASGAEAAVNISAARLGTSATEERAVRSTAEFSSSKIERIERHLQDYKAALSDAVVRSPHSHCSVIVDDFYLVPPTRQPDVIDYLHRLLRGTDLYLKLGTVRHRTTLARYDDGQTIGVELAQDVEGMNLDQTFEDMESTRAYLAKMIDSMAEQVGLNSFTSTHFSEDALLALTLASGGVPRDFLNIFVEAVEIGRSRGTNRRLTPTLVYKGAARVSYQTKLKNLRDDVGQEAAALEAVFQDVTNFCLKEKRKTAFLISQDDVATYKPEHEFVQQLMDFKLIHVIEPDTSAASGRPGRHEAYTLDFALFMEPRLRGIEHAEFWRTDEQRRRRGLREAPVYPLARARAILEARNVLTTEDTIAAIRAELGSEDNSVVEEL